MATTIEPQPTELHIADSHDVIRVQGARVNNLKDVSVEIPKRRLTVFTGVSGSGKSSLVFGTIAAESQRLINETYSAFVQGFMPTLARPEVDVLDGLTTAISVDQERMGSDPRSTVGTATDVDAMLRILFSRLAQPHIGPPGAYSFNVASVHGSGGITVGPADQPGTSIVLHPPAADPGVTEDERRTIAEMMAKGTYAMILLATPDLDGVFARLQASDAEVVQEPTEQPYGVRDCAVRDPAGNLIRIQERR